MLTSVAAEAEKQKQTNKQTNSHTVKSPYKGHFETKIFDLRREVVLYQRFKMYCCNRQESIRDIKTALYGEAILYQRL